jgi:hypothetical protein
MSGFPSSQCGKWSKEDSCKTPSQMYIRSGVGRRAVPVAIQGFEVLIESISELRDNVRETLRQSAWIWYNGVKR